MKDILIGMFSVLFLGGIAHQIFPYWIIVVAAAIVGILLHKNGVSSFIYGFLGAALLWGIIAYRLDAANEGILSGKMGETLGDMSGMTLLTATALLGGLLGGMGAMTGTLGRKLFS